MIYLTVNDAPSGVFKSQVIDVILKMNESLEQDIKLVVLISFRDFKENKRKILEWYPSAIVKKMIPGLANWKKNKIILGLVKGIKKDKIIARGPMAFNLAFRLNENVIYDGRGAVKAELEEFPDMIPDKKIVESIIEAEKNAVLNAKFRIAVSSKLVEYWKRTYSYVGDDHVLIPCTLSNDIIFNPESKDSILEGYGWKRSDLVLVYSGSLAGWQSFEKVNKLSQKFLKIDTNRVLFLSKECDEITQLSKLFPGQVKREWLSHDKVSQYLSIGDYGILIRDQNITNYVASPVKFAEYLSVGLKVLISPELGDFSELLIANNLGEIITSDLTSLEKVNDNEKNRLIAFAKSNFTKQALSNEFKSLTEV
jgi:hypothetical protein